MCEYMIRSGGTCARAYPHSCVQRTRNLIVLFEAGTAPKDLGEPELANSALHVANLALRGAGALTHCEGSLPTPQTM